MRIKVILALLLIILSTACETDLGDSPVDLAATADALSLGQAQLQIVRRQQTATAQAVAARATAEAKATRAAIDQVNATATAEAKRTAQAEAEEARQTAAAQAAGTATVQAHVFELTATADALALQQRIAEATATADGQAILSAQERQAATATAAAVERIRVQAEQDAAQARQVSAIMAWLAPAGMLLAILAIVALLYRLTAQWIDAQREKWRLDNQRVALMSMLIETRQGTVVFVGGPREGYTPRLLGSSAGAPGEEFDATQLASAAPIETLRVNGPKGTQFIAREDPGDAPAETGRKLALRLLRAAAGVNGWDSNVIPTAERLCWPSETRQRAVDLLRAHVTTKQGRRGGTFIGAAHGTIMGLYNDVGARKVDLSPSRRRASPVTSNSLRSESN